MRETHLSEMWLHVAALAASSSTGESYVVFGGNVTGGAETQVVDATANTLTVMQGAGVEILIAGRGDDTLISDGGDDVLRGNGTDTLLLVGSGLTLDLTTITDNRFGDIEQIDISDGAANTLALDVSEASNISSFAITLIVRRDNDDAVNRGGGWTEQAYEVIGTDTFEVFRQWAATIAGRHSFYNNSFFDFRAIWFR